MKIRLEGFQVLRPIFAFDFDGVLANSLPVALEEFERLIEMDFPDLPVPRSQTDMAQLFAGPLKTSLRRFGVPDEMSRQFFDKHSAAMRARAHEVILFESVVDQLNRLDLSEVAVVTSAYSDAVRTILNKAGYSKLSRQLTVFGRELSLPKSEKFRLFAENTNRDIKDVIKIGDMVSDILYAREAGVQIWSVGWGYHPGQYLSVFAPDRIIENQNQFSAIMKEYEYVEQ